MLRREFAAIATAMLVIAGYGAALTQISDTIYIRESGAIKWIYESDGTILSRKAARKP